ncbi:hypothetical protein GA0115240_142180 [Streptomyces sp. DvalAA-14]|uniref:DUF6879 family protein n=1 Tax=unclassified Streptomyces TaxID=2593676 RepID=UPI00081B9665|nr:DUF6879 family protein [Streptomyces sp. DvalAA-14]MYS22517.1 hypothetical protein [Streptomyces sp. SID4948]SCE17611.1 hypothetical protein GA0115240_142180 [Streptomyces sp. DvalAA-14]
MFDSFPHGVSTRLARPSYHEEYYRTLKSGIGHLNKLERGQNFKERGFASWEAFASRQWDKALSLIEERRDAYVQQVEEVERLGVLQRRLRVVEFPVTPYVQWELHVLRLRVEVGDRIRLLDARAIRDIEKHRPVPEVVILGDVAMFEVQYDDDGNADGANHYADPGLIAETSAGFDELYAQGEEYARFFDREIAPLPPPATAP